MRSDRRDAGTVTAELAACLPVLVLIVAVAVSSVTVAAARVRVQDAAREAARAAARADIGAAASLASTAAPNAVVQLNRVGDLVVARVTVVVHPLASWLPAMTISERSTALAEPP
ncbi:MAG: hypothetical protein QOG80_2774 [Pseudonocardiales bacterium]|jgi:Flp pilus assembly protein TadG|nr:hypothetical protein [Pseudonocardiales bacterium]